MQPTLTLQEEQLAKNLKAQGKSTQEIMGALAKSRTEKITPPKEVQEKQAGVFSRIAKDIPSDFMEMGAGVRSSIANSSRNLRETWQDPTGTFAQKAAATGPQLGKAVLDVGGEAILGYGKMLTTDEFEKSVSKKISETGQQVADSNLAKQLSAIYEQLPEQSKFVLKRIIAPTAEVAFEGATLGTGTAASQVAKQGARQIGEQATKEIGEITTGAFRNVDDVIVAPLPVEVKSDIVQGFDTAIKPNLSSKQTPVQRARYDAQVAQAVESIANNVDELKLVDEATGEVVSKLPENLKEFVDALEQTKQTIFKQYDDIASKAGEMQARVDTVKIANSLDEIINSQSLRLSNPESIAYAQSVRDRLLSTRGLTALDAQDVIRNYNNSLEAFYRNPTPEGLSRNAVDAMVANQMRRALDEEVEALTGAQYQALKTEYAALKAVERDIMRAYNRDARKNTKGLIDFTDVFSGGQVIAGIMSFNPALIAQGFGQKAIAGAIKMVNDPNRKVKQIFQEAGRYRRPKTGFETPTRRQLPAATPGAPRSSVSAGSPVPLGGQTARGPVDVGLTDRVRPGALKQPAQTGQLRQQAKRFRTVESFVKAVEQNPAWKKKFDEAGVTPKEIGEMVIAGGAALSLVYLLDDEQLGGMGMMVMGSILGGSTARKTFVKQIAKKANEADLVEMSNFTGAFKEGAYKTNNKGEMVVKETDSFTQAEAQSALNDALRRAEDFPVISNATLKELNDVFEDVLKATE